MSRITAIPGPASTPRLQVAARVGAAVIGGYAFTWGFIAAAMALLFATGMEFHDIEFLASALGLLVFLGLFLWVFATRRRTWLVWAWLLGGGALLSAIGSLVQAALV